MPAQLHLKIGQRLQVREAMSEGEWYPSRVEDLSDAGIIIGVPIKAGTLVPISVGSTVQVQLFQEDASYAFSSEVLGRRSTGVPMLMLKAPDSFERFQRRAHFRLPIVLEVLYRPVNGPEKKKAVTLDISGGGLCLVSGEKVDNELVLEMEINLLASGWAAVRGTVVKCVEMPDRAAGGAPRYMVGVQFLEMPAAVEERVVSFIFAQQRERRQRELGMR